MRCPGEVDAEGGKGKSPLFALCQSQGGSKPKWSGRWDYRTGASHWSAQSESGSEWL